MTKRSKLHWLAGVSLAMLFISTALALVFKTYTGTEIAIIRAIYLLGDALRIPMIVITQLGTPWLIFGIVIALAVLHQYRTALRLLIAGGGVYLVVSSMKLIMTRPRPFLEYSDIISRELTISGYGFPSGHSAIAAFTALSLWHLVHPKARPWLVLAVVLVGVSRIYLGVHSPLDVIGGYSIGVFIGCIQLLIPSVLKGVKSR